MDNLSAFRERVISLYHSVSPFPDGHRPNQQDLARAVGLARAELSRRLNGIKGARLSADNARAIVRTLASWGAIQTRASAVELLRLIGVAPFSEEEWQSPPLDQLTPAHPLSSLRPNPGNLPAPLTSFVGREGQLAAVRQLLSQPTPESRLLTVIGAGGAGKSRFIIEVASGLLDEYPDGSYLVPLSDLHDPYLVGSAIAETLGCHQEPGRALAATLIDFLVPRRLLLMLDNCEHLAAACAQMSEALLSACPQLTILASSREVLGVPGETPWPLPPLTVPDLSQTPTPGRLLDYEAVRLFVLRAQTARPGFQLTARNAPAVAQVCARLDGIPLSIELAAALCSVLDVGKIAERLDDALTFLTNSLRSAPPHHQTLQASIEWSYNLLGEEERRLLRQLAVFNGGWTLEAAEAVCLSSEANPASGELLVGLVGLVQKSLVQVVEQEGITRYQMLDTIRKYAAARLAEAGEEQAMRLRHATLYLTLAEQGFASLHGTAQAEWLNRLEAEHDNLRAALSWMLAHNEPDMTLRMCAALWPLWYTHGHTDEASRVVNEALRISAGVVSSTRARVLREAGTLVMDQGDYAASQPFFSESLAISRQLGDKHGIGNSLNRLAIIQVVEGDYAAARCTFEESLALAKELGYKEGVAAVLSNLGGLSGMSGDYDTARQLTAEALAIYEQLGDERNLTGTLVNAAGLALKQDDYAAALAFCTDCLPLLNKLGDKPNAASCLEQLALVSATRGRSRVAATLLGAAATLRESVRLPRSLQDGEYDLVFNRCRASLDEEALTCALDDGQQMDFAQALSYASAEALILEQDTTLVGS